MNLTQLETEPRAIKRNVRRLSCLRCTNLLLWVRFHHLRSTEHTERMSLLTASILWHKTCDRGLPCECRSVSQICWKPLLLISLSARHRVPSQQIVRKEPQHLLCTHQTAQTTSWQASVLAAREKKKSPPVLLARPRLSVWTSDATALQHSFWLGRIEIHGPSPVSHYVASDKQPCKSLWSEMKHSRNRSRSAGGQQWVWWWLWFVMSSKVIVQPPQYKSHGRKIIMQSSRVQGSCVHMVFLQTLSKHTSRDTGVHKGGLLY